VIVPVVVGTVNGVVVDGNVFLISGCFFFLSGGNSGMGEELGGGTGTRSARY
jgi:hypothetical protein